MTVQRDSKPAVPVRARPRADRLLLVAFGVLAALGILLTGVYDYLLKGDQRVMVVTLQQGVHEGDRDTLKRDCGVLPGVSLVADKGAADKQYRLPVRFRIAGSTPAQEAALETCLGQHPQLVRGFEIEGDGV